MVHHLPITKARINLGSVVKQVHLNKEYVVLEKGQYRLRVGRWRFRYDIEGHDVVFYILWSPAEGYLRVTSLPDKPTNNRLKQLDRRRNYPVSYSRKLYRLVPG